MVGGIEVRGADIIHRRGDTGCLDVYLFMGDEPYELKPGDTGKFSVKKHITSTEYIFQKTLTEDGGFILEPSDTKDLKPGTYRYDVEITLATGEVVTIAIGKYKLLGDITREVSE